MKSRNTSYLFLESLAINTPNSSKSEEILLTATICDNALLSPCTTEAEARH